VLRKPPEGGAPTLPAFCPRLRSDCLGDAFAETDDYFGQAGLHEIAGSAILDLGRTVFRSDVTRAAHETFDVGFDLE